MVNDYKECFVGMKLNEVHVALLREKHTVLHQKKGMKCFHSNSLLNSSFQWSTVQNHSKMLLQDKSIISLAGSV